MSSPLDLLKTQAQIAAQHERDGDLTGAIQVLSEALSQPEVSNQVPDSIVTAHARTLRAWKEKEQRIADLIAQAETTERTGEYDSAESAWKELLELSPGHQKAVDGLERVPQLKKSSESMRLKVTVEDALERGEGILASKALKRYLELNPGDLWAIEQKPAAQEAKEKEERSQLDSALKGAISANQYRKVLEIGKTLKDRGWLEGQLLDLCRHSQDRLQEAKLLKQKAHDCLNNDDLDHALEHLERAASIDVEDPELAHDLNETRELVWLKRRFEQCCKRRDLKKANEVAETLRERNCFSEADELLLVKAHQARRFRRMGGGVIACVGIIVAAVFMMEGRGYWSRFRDAAKSDSSPSRITRSESSSRPMRSHQSNLPMEPFPDYLSGSWHEGVIGTIQTGQTQSRLSGDDGFHQRGRERGFVDNGDGTISDRNTGIMWIKNPNSAGAQGMFSWEEALALCRSLDYAGHSDWELPEMRQLLTVCNIDGRNCDEPIFDLQIEDKAKEFWSATEYIHNSKNSLKLMFWTVGVYPREKSSKLRVLPMRYERKPLEIDYSQRFVSLQEGKMIYDRCTDLTWLVDLRSAELSQKRSWNDAISFVSGLDYLGFDDWRVPNTNEVISVLSIEKDHASRYPVLWKFVEPRRDTFFTSSSKHRCVVANFNDGLVDWQANEDARYFVLPVRGGVGDLSRLPESSPSTPETATAINQSIPSTCSPIVSPPADLKWITKAPLPTPRMALRGSAIDGKIYVVGGRSRLENPATTNEMYDPKTDTWTSRAPMQSPRARFELAACGGKLYAIGGIGKDGVILNTVEIYDPLQDTWTTAPPIKRRRTYFASCVIGENIYILGGAEDSETLGTCEVFSTTQNNWKSLSDMPKPKSDLVTVVWNGQIYAIGGIPPLEVAEVFRYDPESNRWDILTSNMPTPRVRFSGGVLGEQIVTVGGNLTGVVETFNPTINTWKAGPPLPTARENHCVVTLDGVLYAIGGRHQSEGMVGTNEALVNSSVDAQIDVQNANQANRDSSPSEALPNGPPQNPQPGQVWKVSLLAGAEMELVYVPGGTFMIGTDRADLESVSRWSAQFGKGFPLDKLIHETPRHSVTVQPFWIGKYEVTDSQYRFEKNDRPEGFLPVVNLSKIEASNYISRLNKEVGLSFRLPTESEWEFACRAGSDNLFYWGDDGNQMSRYANVKDRRYNLYHQSRDDAGNWDDGYGERAPTGTFEPNSFGLYDMIGNVNEWCEDSYFDSYASHPSDGSAVKRPSDVGVVRGGSWSANPAQARCGSRIGMRPSTKFAGVGLRLVHDAR